MMETYIEDSFRELIYLVNNYPLLAALIVPPAVLFCVPFYLAFCAAFYLAFLPVWLIGYFSGRIDC